MLMLSEDNGGDVEHDDADCDDSYDDDEYEYAVARSEPRLRAPKPWRHRCTTTWLW